jgi:predicted PurR-regulated permease PerM
MRNPLTIDPRRQEGLGIVLFYAIALLLGYLAYRIFEPFFSPLLWAAILAVLTYPLYERLSRRFGPNRAALLTTAGVTLVLIVPMIFVLSAFVRQAMGAVRAIQLGVELGRYTWVNRFWDGLQSRFPQLIPYNLGNMIHNYAEQAASFAAGRVGGILRNTAAILMDTAFTILAMFYFYRDGASIVTRLRDGLPFEEAQRVRVVKETHSLIFATVLSTLTAAAVHGVVGTAAFALTGIRSPIFWGVLMGFFSFIPLIGTALIWVPLSLSLALGGHLAAGVILVAICSVVLGMIDNFVRPLMISGRADMSMLLIFIGVLGGIEAFGLLGVVLGPVILAIAATLLNVYVPGAHAGTTESKASGKKTAAVLE